VDGLNSNLNLNEGAPPRAMPRLGDWGPMDVPGTRTKKWQRWFAVGAFVLVLAAVVVYAYLMYQVLS